MTDAVLQLTEHTHTLILASVKPSYWTQSNYADSTIKKTYDATTSKAKWYALWEQWHDLSNLSDSLFKTICCWISLLCYSSSKLIYKQQLKCLKATGKSAWFLPHSVSRGFEWVSAAGSSFVWNAWEGTGLSLTCQQRSAVTSSQTAAMVINKLKMKY